MSWRSRLAGCATASVLAVGVVVPIGVGSAPPASGITTDPNLEVATPGATDGWGATHAAPRYVYVRDEMGGTGSLEFATPTPSSVVDYARPADARGAGPIALATTEFAFEYINVSGSLPDFVLQVGTGPGAATPVTLVWDPALQPPGTTSKSTSWQATPPLTDGDWWSSASIPGDPASSAAHPVAVPFSRITAANPGAVLDAYGLSQGPGDAGAVNDIDYVTFVDDATDPIFPPGDTTDFEPLIQTFLAATPYVLGSAGGLPALGSVPTVSATLTYSDIVTGPHAPPCGFACETGPVPGVPITFTTGSTTICTAVTDRSGRASCPTGLKALLDIAFVGGYSAAYAGDSVREAATARAGLIG